MDAPPAGTWVVREEVKAHERRHRHRSSVQRMPAEGVAPAVFPVGSAAGTARAGNSGFRGLACSGPDPLGPVCEQDSDIQGVENSPQTSLERDRYRGDRTGGVRATGGDGVPPTRSPECGRRARLAHERYRTLVSTGLGPWRDLVIRIGHTGVNAHPDRVARVTRALSVVLPLGFNWPRGQRQRDSPDHALIAPSEHLLSLVLFVGRCGRDSGRAFDLHDYALYSGSR